MSKAVIYYSLTGNTKEAAKEIARKLGAKLFERTTPLKLTYAGERFLDYANRLVQAETEMMSEFQDIADERKGQIIYTCWLRMNI